MSRTLAFALSALALAAPSADAHAPATLVSPATPAPPTNAALPAAAPANAAAPAALWGPPAICHPIDIGDARSLPWGDGAFEVDGGYDRARLVPDTVALLDGTDDLLVHMETLRRAVILITGLATPYDPSAKQVRAEAHALGAALEARLVRARAASGDTSGTVSGTASGEVSGRASGDGPATNATDAVDDAAPNDAAARALFDLGYLSAALAQARSDLRGDDGHARLLEAAAALSADPAAQLGVVLATCGHGTPDAQTWRHLDKLFTLVHDRDDPWEARVAKNAAFIVGPFLGVGARDRDALAALAHERNRGA